MLKKLEIKLKKDGTGLEINGDQSYLFAYIAKQLMVLIPQMVKDYENGGYKIYEEKNG